MMCSLFLIKLHATDLHLGQIEIFRRRLPDVFLTRNSFTYQLLLKYWFHLMDFLLQVLEPQMIRNECDVTH